MNVLLRGIISPTKKLIEEGVRGITPGDWAECVEHFLTVERVYILIKGDRGRGIS